jgi:hypothetical protein
MRKLAVEAPTRLCEFLGSSSQPDVLRHSASARSRVLGGGIQNWIEIALECFERGFSERMEYPRE